MHSPLKYAVVASAAVVILMLLFTIANGSSEKPQSSSEPEETAPNVVTREIIVASEMPERISLDVPAGFTSTSSQYYDQYYIKEDASIIITGEYKSVPVRVSDYAADVLEQYRNTADNFASESEDTLVVDGQEVRVFEFRYDIPAADATLRMRCMSAVLANGHDVFIVTCKSHYETYGAYRDAFIKAIQSIRIAPETYQPAGSGSSTTAAGTESPAA